MAAVKKHGRSSKPRPPALEDALNQALSTLDGIAASGWSGALLSSKARKQLATAPEAARGAWLAGAAFTKRASQGATGLAVTDALLLTAELRGSAASGANGAGSNSAAVCDMLAWAQGSLLCIAPQSAAGGGGGSEQRIALGGSAITALSAAAPGSGALWVGHQDGSVRLVDLKGAAKLPSCGRCFPDLRVCGRGCRYGTVDGAPGHGDDRLHGLSPALSDHLKRPGHPCLLSKLDIPSRTTLTRDPVPLLPTLAAPDASLSSPVFAAAITAICIDGAGVAWAGSLSGELATLQAPAAAASGAPLVQQRLCTSRGVEGCVAASARSPPNADGDAVLALSSHQGLIVASMGPVVQKKGAAVWSAKATAAGTLCVRPPAGVCDDAPCLRFSCVPITGPSEQAARWQSAADPPVWRQALNGTVLSRTKPRQRTPSSAENCADLPPAGSLQLWDALSGAFVSRTATFLAGQSPQCPGDSTTLNLAPCIALRELLCEDVSVLVTAHADGNVVGWRVGEEGDMAALWYKKTAMSGVRCALACAYALFCLLFCSCCAASAAGTRRLP